MKRAARVVAVVLLGGLAVTALAVGGALTVARTSWGAEHLRRFVLPRLNAALAGNLEVRRLAFTGDEIVLDGVMLRDPEGGLVARVARLDIKLSPLALLRHRLQLRAVAIEEPFLSLRQDAEGTTNLARALAGKDAGEGKKPPGAGDEPADARGTAGARWDLELTALTIRGGVVDVRDERVATAPALRHMRLIDVDIQGAAQLGAGAGAASDRAFAVRADVRGEATHPLRGPIALMVGATGRLAPSAVHADGDVDLKIADSTLQLRARAQSAEPATAASKPDRALAPGAASLPALSVTLDIERARIVPELLRLVAPTSPVKAAITITGHATWDGATEKLATKLDVAAAATTVALTASLDVGRGAVDGLSIRARGIDLGRLIVEGPPSDLSFDLDAHGEGRTLGTLRGAATLRVPAGRLGGYALGPIRFRADADRGRYKVMDLVARFPGLDITGAGEGTAHAIALRAALELRDLGATVRSVTAGRTRGSPRAAGKGRVDIEISGDPRAPALRVTGRLAGLTWEQVRIPSLRLALDVPDLRTPLASGLSIDVPRASAGNRDFGGLVVNLRAAGPRFDASVALESPEALRLVVGGSWNRDHTQIVFDRFKLRSRRATWNLAGTSRLTVDQAQDVVSLSGFDLRAEGGQALRLDVEKRSRAIRASVAINALDLAKLPESFVPPTLKLAGRLDATVQARGSTVRPAIDARVKLAAARFGDVRDVDLTSNARLIDKRVSGTVDLKLFGASLDGHFDLPTSWPPPPAAPLTAELAASNVDLERVARGFRGARDQLSSGASIVVVPSPLPEVRGTGAMNLKLDGTGAAPRLRFDAGVRQLQIGATAVGDVTVLIDAPGTRAITARLELRSTPGAGALQAGRPGVIELRTGFALGTLLRHPPSTEAILTTPLHVDAHLDGVQLGPLAALARYPRKLAGSFTLAATLDGTPRTARGKVDLTLTGVSTGKFPPTDGTLRANLGDRDVSAEVQVSRKGATLFSLKARAGAPVSRFRDLAVVADVPLEVHAILGPLDLQRVGLPPETDRHPARTLKGRVRAQADVTGTLRAPRLNARADATDIHLDQTRIGDGVLLVTYSDRKVKADVNVVSANGGRLHLAAATEADLGLPGVTRGFDLERLPITARLDANEFDVSGLSGATPGLRSVAGRLFAAVDVTGTAADPRPSGRMEWKEGGLTVTGMGEYKHIHFLAHGDKEHLVVDELRADSGGGRARLTASGDHQSGAGYAVKAALDLDEFPAYVEGQALATISLKASAESQLSVRRVRAKVSIASARLALSDAKRKHLQTLAGPADVVLMDDGTPLNQAQARKLAAVTATLRANLENRAKPSASADAPTDRPAGVVVRVNAPRNLWVSGKDANVELGLQPDFRVEVTDATRVFGTVEIKRGRMDVVGRRFDLKAGSTLRFVGPSDAPELDITAKHVNEKEQITVMVTVKGSPGHLQIAITAPDRPDLTETQLYTLIVTGRLAFGGGTTSSATPTDRAASLVGGLVAAQLQKSLSKKLPFDVLTIEAGDTPGAARLEAGTYVTSDLYVGYVGRLGADPSLLQNRNAVHLEYELGSRWSFQGEYGDAKTGSADVIWTKRY